MSLKQQNQTEFSDQCSVLIYDHQEGPKIVETLLDEQWRWDYVDKFLQIFK
ncbi:unnamed protein product (macronuclear) [Paramecium tetraurelia]|uniref:Uncharacterized protein n=1 Tax=Paramecium tetraurelia TaxID=5888 RepID=A0DZ64_PARTE|nr:uncharacterized protein GSPATT00003300001 [Paramecium tetraurelia]CAK88331.1 unnamed protein product [Paramecium tetraurelia]|eukprot:XP_001455728.1 hypothetical protein (macronuclear) [Paramecium tetraurelia strain d4-2]